MFRKVCSVVQTQTILQSEQGGVSVRWEDVCIKGARTDGNWHITNCSSIAINGID